MAVRGSMAVVASCRYIRVSMANNQHETTAVPLFAQPPTAPRKQEAVIRATAGNPAPDKGKPAFRSVISTKDEEPWLRKAVQYHAGGNVDPSAAARNSVLDLCLAGPAPRGVDTRHGPVRRTGRFGGPLRLPHVHDEPHR